MSPFSPQFRDIINAALESLVQLLKLRGPIQRVIREHDVKFARGDASSVVDGLITTVIPGIPNATYNVESRDGAFTLFATSPLNRWADYRFLPAAVDDTCQIHINTSTGEVIGAVIWETPDSKVC